MILFRIPNLPVKMRSGVSAFRQTFSRAEALCREGDEFLSDSIPRQVALAACIIGDRSGVSTRMGPASSGLVQRVLLECESLLSRFLEIQLSLYCKRLIPGENRTSKLVHSTWGLSVGPSGGPVPRSRRNEYPAVINSRAGRRLGRGSSPGKPRLKW